MTAFHQKQIARRSFRVNKILRSNEDWAPNSAFNPNVKWGWHRAVRTAILWPCHSLRKDKKRKEKQTSKGDVLWMWLCALDQGFLGDFLPEQSSVSGLLWSFSAAPQCQQLSTRAETSGWKGINISVGICSSLLKTSTKVPLLWLVEWAQGEEDYCMYWAHDPWPQLGILRTIFSKTV